MMAGDCKKKFKRNLDAKTSSGLHPTTHIYSLFVKNVKDGRPSFCQLFKAPFYKAIRTLGPVLSLTANSPFLPADLYDDVGDPYEFLTETHHELRIATFEQSVNTSENDKVRVPRDIDDASEVPDRVAADDCFAPFLREWMEDGERDTLVDWIDDSDERETDVEAADD
jgi:hypothetical protein